MDLWEQEQTPSTPGLFPVPLYRNESRSSPEEALCSCGYDCSSGACCCYLGASDLACRTVGGAACEEDAGVSGSVKEEKTCHQEPSELLTLAIAASTVPESNDLHPQETSNKSQKVCKRCNKSLPRSAFCANMRATDGLYTQCRACVSQKDQERRARLKSQKKPPAAAKLCSRCQTKKGKEDFYLDSSRPDGLQTYCKPCFSITYREKRQKRKD